MIVIKSPLRISFIGGGSDLPIFYKKFGGQVFSLAINKYMYIFLKESFDNKIYLKYSKKEVVNNPNKIKHPIAKAIIKYLKLNNIDVSSMCDIPGGLGLGTSSAYTAAFLKAGLVYKKKKINKNTLASKTCLIEISKLNQKIGKQDQYATVFGGFNKIIFKKNDTTKIKKYSFSKKFLHNFYRNSLLIYVGDPRSSSKLLKVQNQNLKLKNYQESLQVLSALTDRFINHFIKADFKNAGKIMDLSWQIKKKLNKNISNKKIDKIYRDFMNKGAYGGKLLGAGSGGFIFLFLPEKLKKNFKKSKDRLNYIDFEISNEGTSKIL